STHSSNSVKNDSRPANIRKYSMGVEDPSISFTRPINIRKNSLEVENSNKNSSTHNSNSVKNDSRPANIRKYSMRVEDPSISFTRPINIRKNSLEVENSNKNSLTHSSSSVKN